MPILPYDEKYREDVIKVCLNTGPRQVYTDPKLKAYILNMYCLYYLDNEKDNIFILVDDNDTACGYILCAPDFYKYKRKMSKYFKVIKETGKANVLEAVFEFLGTMIFSFRYPAHLHIDIDDGFRNDGFGGKLMDAENENLRSKGVKGLMLIVGTFNERAIGFYKKHNFKILFKNKISTVMGIKLN